MHSFDLLNPSNTCLIVNSTDAQRLSDLPKVTKLGSYKAKTQIQVFMTSRFMFLTQ